MRSFDIKICKALEHIGCRSSEMTSFHNEIGNGWQKGFYAIDFLDGQHAQENCKKVFGDKKHDFVKDDYCVNCRCYIAESLFDFCWQRYQVLAMQSGNVVSYITYFLNLTLLNEVKS